MKIVILDGYAENPGDLSWEGFRALGDLTVYDRTAKEDIIDRIGDSEIVITNKTPITREILDACPSIKYVGVLATGYNVIDTVACRERGIPVTNIPTYGTDAVAQFTMAMLLDIANKVDLHSRAVHDGKWESCPDFCFTVAPLMELKGKTVGIIGLGRIGKAFAKLCVAFGMRVIFFNEHNKQSIEGLADYADLDDLLREADVISLHCPQTATNKGLIDKVTIAKMKDGVILLNSSRGGLIVESDLADALKSGKIRACAVDVVSSEPISKDNPLLTAPNLTITPHIAWAARETRARLMDVAVDNLRQYLRGNLVNVVNG